MKTGTKIGLGVVTSGLAIEAVFGIALNQPATTTDSPSATISIVPERMSSADIGTSPAATAQRYAEVMARRILNDYNAVPLADRDTYPEPGADHDTQVVLVNYNASTNAPNSIGSYTLGAHVQKDAQGRFDPATVTEVGVGKAFSPINQSNTAPAQASNLLDEFYVSRQSTATTADWSARTFTPEIPTLENPATLFEATQGVPIKSYLDLVQIELTSHTLRLTSNVQDLGAMVTKATQVITSAEHHAPVN